MDPYESSRQFIQKRPNTATTLQSVTGPSSSKIWIETNTAEEDGSADGIECAVDNGFGGGRDFVSDWFGYFRFYCFHSLFCCFHLQRQACLLIRLSTIQWCFCFLTKRCGYIVDDVFFSEAAALLLL
ncbi:hypothetical protein OIU76_013719 [Salix suchowensis]|nr:hypothetical protein OIU76_013719 [Salix suchowensis]